ncbi:hypothetical protein L1D18_15015 [Vibrio parahaemolyticus]|uniref:hypothetical protein n=1 Tax=Vibrio parahaemolyticus TaxID=670 RepID=UPI001EFCFB2D|nr:hypothetical protein [Vibrio parahaemolyticus]MCG9645420.1 hypothetical protein [Vibrio parahaemolyticus]HCE1608295.1 hypothetical protein [Vibrio parahaemolyticus]HCG8470233.1 hypothetical protein [Vibrio parahaemolyticus]HCG8528508.1 hypothetical protein [Vibrio parahaemolyticus]
MYRYSNSEYSNLLTVFGGIRVGTLHDFRRSEHKRGIADPQEGKKSVEHHIISDTIQLGDKNNINARAVSAFNAIGGSGQVTLKNVGFSRSFDSPDFFILCSAYEKSKTVMHQFDGADSCVQIYNPMKFYRELTYLLNSITPVYFHGVHRVTYKGRKEKWDGHSWGIDPALIKENEFDQQKEVRAIWVPKFGQEISPQILGSVKLASACKPVELKD